MRKSWIGFGTVTGIAAAIAVVPYFIDWNWFKPELVKAVETATGYEVTVAGDIGFSLLPNPRLSAEGVSVVGFGDDRQPLVMAEKLSAAVAFLPLLSKRAEVRYIALETPTVRIVSYADGSSNWKDPDAVEEASAGELAIDDFRIENGTFISVAADGKSTDITDIDMRLGLAGRSGPYSLDGRFRYDGMPLTVVAKYQPGGAVKAEARLDKAATISFAGRARPEDGDGPIQIAGQLEVDAKSLGSLLAAINDDGDVESAAAYKQPFSVRTSVRGNTGSFNFGDINGTVAGSGLGGDISVKRGERLQVTGRLTLARLDAAAWLSDGMPKDDKPFELPDVDADVTLNIADAYFGKVRFGTLNAPLRLGNQVLSIGRTSAVLPGNGHASITGNLSAITGKPSFQGRFAFATPRTAETFKALGNAAYSALPPLRLGGAVTYANDMLQLSGVEGALGEGRLSGSLRYPMDEAASAIELAITLTSLDMRRVVAASGGSEDGEAARPLNFKVALQELFTEGGRYSGIAATGRYWNDRLTLSQVLVRDAFGFGITAKGTIDDLGSVRRTDLAFGLAGESIKGAITAKGPMTRLDVGGAVNFAGATIGLDGWVRTEPDMTYQLTVSTKAPEAGAVLAQLREERRVVAIGPLDLDMNLAGKGNSIVVSNITGKVGSMTIAGEASINTAAEVPRVNATISAGVVPVTALLGDDGTGADAVLRGGERWSSDMLSFDWIRRFDGQVALKADRAIYDMYVLDKPVLSLSAKGGTLSIEAFQAGIYGGKLSATGNLKAGGVQSLALRMALADVPVEPLLKAAAASAPATGTLDMTANVTARGKSQKSIMSSLSGPVQITASDGVIRKVDLQRLDAQLGDLRSANSFVQLAGAALKGGETGYRVLAAELSGKDGRFVIDKVTTDMDGGRATAKGYVDVGAWYADMTAVLTLGSHDDAPSIPAVIKGDLPSPPVSYSLGPLQAWFGKRLALVGIKAATGAEKLDIGGLLGVNTGTGRSQDHAVNQPATGESLPVAKSGSVEEELGGAIAEGLGKLLGRKKTQPVPADPPATDKPLEPANLGEPE